MSQNFEDTSTKIVFIEDEDVELNISFHDGWGPVAIGYDGEYRASLDVSKLELSYLNADDLRKIADIVEQEEIRFYREQANAGS